LIPEWLIEGAAKLVAPIVVRVVELLEERSRVTPPPAPTREGILAGYHEAVERRRRAELAAALREAAEETYDAAEAEYSQAVHDGGL
jgi:hypothetical protein